jgi:hypothetical protein
LSPAETIELYRAGLLHIVPQHTYDCLLGLRAGAPLVQEPCSSVPSELWSLSAVGTAFQLVNSGTGQCTAIDGQHRLSGQNRVGALLHQRQLPLELHLGLITPLTPAVAQAGQGGQGINISWKSNASGANVVPSACAGATNE